MQILDQVKHANKTVKVCFDPDPLNPREEYDNITDIVHWHNRYDFGSKIDSMTSEELIEEHKDNDPILAILPLYLYDHSGISLSVGGSCSFGSGQVGWIYITESKAKLMGCENFTPEQLEQAIRDDIKTYDDYLTGQVFGFMVEGENGEVLESCWGFIGNSEDCMLEGKLAAESCIDPAMLSKAEELSNRVTYAGVYA